MIPKEFSRLRSRLVCQNLAIWNGFHQTESEDRRGDAKREIVLRGSGDEIGLNDGAIAGVGAAADDEQIVTRRHRACRRDY